MLRWIAPGAITVLCGTSIAVAMTTASIERTLLVEQGTFNQHGHSWASGRFLPPTVPVAADVAPRSGERESSSGTSMLPFEQLSYIDRGAAIIGSEVSVTGAPPSEVAEGVITRLAQAGGIVVLDPPQVDDYWVSASLQLGGTLVFDGYAPDSGTRERFAAVPGADVTWLKLGRGEPERYASHVDFGLSVLDRLDEGRFSLRENVAVITGTAATATDYLTLRALREEGPPQGMVLAMFDVKAPLSGEYRWQASKSSSGQISFSGLLPSPDVEAFLSARAGITGLSGVGYASGEPANFAAMAETALALLGRLTEGRVEFDGRGWTLTGTPKSMDDRAVLESDFTARQLAASGWSMALATSPEHVTAPPSTIAAELAAELVAPQAQATVETPTQATDPVTEIDPNYAFSATLAADGTAVLAGQVPSPTTLQFVSSALAGANTDAVSTAPGAPATFGASLQTGLRALVLLSEGSLDFSEGRWRLSGTATTRENERAATALLGADPGPWDIEIVAPAQSAIQSALAEPLTPNPSAGAALCESALADFSARNAILFQSGAAIISADSDAALDELAEHLADCPEALVHVEGHTDADGEETLNLALSVARAEAVVAGLIERGVAPQRLYALGFGEAMPIAPNDTADGKRQNRRIVVKLAGSDS